MPVKTSELVTHEFIVQSEQSGQRLDRLLGDLYPRFSRMQWQLRIKSGLVSLSEGVARPGRRVKAGVAVRFQFSRRAEPPVNRGYRILYGAGFKDRFYIIDKPTNLPVHAAGVYFKHTLLEFLREDFGQDVPLYPVHRLDRETSGLLLMACDGEAARELQKIFVARQIVKEYKVIVEGAFPEYLDAQGFIGLSGQSPVQKKMAFAKKISTEDWRDCRTEFHCLRQFPLSSKKSNTDSDGSKNPQILSLLKANLHTGRTHQIRATLCSLGFPVVGDRLYGVDDKLYIKFIEGRESNADLERLRLNRTSLHCARLVFANPFQDGSIDISSELPADMQTLIHSSSE